MTVHFIGAGPGAADLLTVRAVTLLRTSPVCLYAGTYLDPDPIPMHFVRPDRSGKDVALKCPATPSIYTALTEQTRRLDAHDVAWDVTPGVPAYAAAAALLGSELTVPELVQSVVLTRT